MLFSSSEVNRSWILILRHEMPSFLSFHVIVSSWLTAFSTSRMAEGAKSKASSTFKLIMWMKIRWSTSLLVLACVFSEAIVRWLFKVFNQSEDVNRWIRVNEQRSRSLGDMMSFWVTMITRQAKCLWRRTIVINEFVSFCAVMNSLIYWIRAEHSQCRSSSSWSEAHLSCVPYRVQ